MSLRLQASTAARCEGAALLKTTTEIAYDDPSGDLTDLLVQIAGAKVGVSVTRAVSFPVGEPYPQETADALIANRLAEVNASSDNVKAEDAWVKQVLVVIAFSDDHADRIETAWAAQDPATKADTVVYVVVTHGSDLPVYGV